jgi:hypothetical protein
MSVNTDNLDFDEQIKLNEIHRDIAMTAATDLLTASKQRLDVNLDLPTTDLMIACHALLAQREYDGLKTWPMFNDIKSKLEGVAESINNLASNFEKLDENLVYIRGIKEQLEYVVESIDCAAAKPTEFWMQSGLAANKMAESLGIDTRACETFDDVRYLIAKKLAENADGAGL